MNGQLSDFQKKRAAENIVERLELQENLQDLGEKLDEIFDDAPIEVAEATSKEEMEEIITDINNGTADNNRISRFLELAEQFSLA